MPPRTGAKVGISVTPASSVIVLAPTASPKAAMPIGSAAATSEPKARSRIAAATRIPISSPALPPLSAKAKNRSPPISMRSGESAALPVADGRPGRRDRPPTAPLDPGTGPAGPRPARPGRRLRCGRRIPAPRPAPPPGRSCPARGAATRCRPAAGRARHAPGRSRRSVVAASFGVTTTWAVIPARSEPGRVEQVRGPLGVQPGKRSTESVVLPPRAPAAPTAKPATSSHTVITRQGWRAALPPRRAEGLRQHRVLQHSSATSAAAADDERRDRRDRGHRPLSCGFIGPAAGRMLVLSADVPATGACLGWEP